MQSNMAGIGSPKGVKQGGRAVGTPNKATRELKDMILGALNSAGGEAYLVTQATENPGPFMSLIAKVLPKDLTVAGDPNNPILHNHAISHSALQAIDALVGAVNATRAPSGNPEASQD